MEAGNRSSLIHTSGSSSSTRSCFLLTLHFLGALLLPCAGSVYKDSAAQCGWHSQGPGRTRCPGRISSACTGQEVQIQVFGERGSTWVCSSWSNPAPCRIFLLLHTAERGSGSLMMRIDFPLSQTWVVSSVQKECYVWEGHISRAGSGAMAITQSCSCLPAPKPPHSSCTAVSTLLFIHMVCPGLYLSSRDWEMPKSSPVKFSHCYE